MIEKTRTEHTKSNIKAGIVQKIVVIVLPFITRTIMIKSLGTEYTGLSGLFSAILNIFNVAELGFATAIAYSLYKPIALGDNEMVCALMCYFRKIYKIIGVIISALSILILPLLKYMIKGSIPNELNVYVLFMLTAFYNVAGYLLFAYKDVVIGASQRQDILHIIDVGICLVQFCLQCFVLLIFKSYYLFLIIQISCVLLRNLIVGYVSKKMFPQYEKKGPKLNVIEKKKILMHVKGIAIGKITTTSRNGFDSMMISYYCGLFYVTIYDNYYYVLGAVNTIIGTISSAIMASVGNSIALESKEKNFRDYMKFDFYYWIIRVVCSLLMLLLYQPFMHMWVGSDVMLTNSSMILFVIYFYITSRANIRSAYIAGSGIWNKLQTINCIELGCNIILNIVLGIVWGMNGILIASIVTVFVCSIIGNSVVLFKEYFERNAWFFLKEMMEQDIIAILLLGIAYFIFLNVLRISVIGAIGCAIFIFFILFLNVVCVKRKYRRYVCEIIKRCR